MAVHHAMFIIFINKFYWDKLKWLYGAVGLGDV